MKDIENPPILPLGMYQHFKGGIYEALEIACHSETLEWYVVYQSQERKEQGLPSIWVRPYHMFVETTERDGKTVKRFTKIDD